ncbi:MAG: 3-hydroxybutyryl-CoA dehydrogenase, partial [Oscillospiraceae bacterium]|nr:3-hydroxybutyryl-CoA dehydrogenase [Oscillospiraceae bacterium]
RITFSSDTDYSDIGDTDLVLEAAIERLELKKQIFRKLDAVAKPGCILATNTSSISISEIASAAERKELVIGMHFFNPPTVMKLIEIIRGGGTCDSAYETVFALAQEIGKTPVTVNEAPGFVVNRLLVPMINEAIELVQSGVASPEDIDTAMRLGCNHPMGPLTLGDFIGLDTCLAIMETLYAETCDSKYRPSMLLRKMVRSGKLGNKSGEGFFKH